MEPREQAEKLYRESGGRMLLKDIAVQLGIAEGTVRSWKKRGNWDGDPATLHVNATQRRRHASVNRKAAETISANDKLDEHEKDFCAAFVHAPNASQAAVLTGRYSTYGSARMAACKMMKRPAVIAEINRLKAMKRATLLADGDDVIEMHMRIAFADMSAFVEWGQEEVPIIGDFGPIEIEVDNPETGEKEKKKLTRRINTIRLKEHAEVDGTVIQQVKVGRDGASVKLVDRQNSLDFLERYFMLNPMDRHKKDFDLRKLKLEEDKLQKGSEEALAKLDAMMRGLDEVMNRD